jgi:hypothetical protein
MNRTEERLRAALDGAARTVHQDDLRPLVARPPRSWVRRHGLVAATGSGLVMAAVGVLQLWPMQTNSAAAWTAKPQAEDPGVTTQLVGHCLSMRDDIVEAERSATPKVIVDQRGNSAVVNIQDGPYVGACSFMGLDRSDPQGLRFVGSNAGWFDEDDAPLRPIGDAILTVETLSSSAVDGDALTEISGQVGPGVHRVVVTLDDGSEVEASLDDGWYLAWWPEEMKWSLPWDRKYDMRSPTLVRAYDATGTLLKEHVPTAVPGR